tara:strand:+ start:954 stop:1202 length:249 start_codon:yes stop_codon:yes gene_type:complete
VLLLLDIGTTVNTKHFTLGANSKYKSFVYGANDKYRTFSERSYCCKARKKYIPSQTSPPVNNTTGGLVRHYIPIASLWGIEL